MKSNKSLFEKSPDIIPVDFSKGMNISKFVHALGQTSFEARNVYKGAKLYKHIINSDNIIWLGIAGAGIAGGMGGIVISLIKAGFIDVICSTGAQVYHDLHFAFDLPVKAIHPTWDDDILRKHGDTRIYDIGIREEETLEAQDEIIRNFIKDSYKILSNHPLSSCEFNKILGDWVNKHARYPERSFVATAARYNVPVFWDSLSNHSIAMNLVRTDREGYPIQLSAQKDILSSAAITYNSEKNRFLLNLVVVDQKTLSSKPDQRLARSWVLTLLALRVVYKLLRLLKKKEACQVVRSVRPLRGGNIPLQMKKN